MEGKWKVADNVLSSKIDEEVILMSIENDRYFSLDLPASRIWELLETPHSLNELCARLMEEYEIEEDACRKDTEEFLREMAEKKLIQEVGE
jgi:hypothetical protein